MPGLAQQVVRRGENPVRDRIPSGVYGLVVSRTFPDLDLVRETVTRVSTEPSQESDYPLEGSVWACAETDTVARSILQDPILLPLVASWRFPGGDLRRMWRDTELLLLCDRCYVFQKAGAKTQWTTWRDRGVYTGLHLIEGKPAAKKARRAFAPA